MDTLIINTAGNLCQYLNEVSYTRISLTTGQNKRPHVKHQTSSRDHFTFPRTYFWRRHQDSQCTRPISTSYQPNSPSGWRSREIFRSETTKKGRKFQKISRSTTKQSLNKHKRNLKAEIALKLVIWFQSKLIRSRRPPQSIQYALGKDYTATSISSRTRKTS